MNVFVEFATTTNTGMAGIDTHMGLVHNSMSDYVKHYSDLAMEWKRGMIRIYRTTERL